MADEGPTTAATLVAKFRGDDSDVMESIKRVRAAAIELGTTDVDVKVHASGADKAIADLDRTRTAVTALDVSDEKLFTTTKKLNNENATTLKRWQAITIAVFALMPLLAPLLGYTVALGGGFAAMGAAGVLAVLGIRSEMQSGSKDADNYAAGIRVLRGDLDQLGHTAASSLLGSFDNVLAQIQQRMPQLTRDTGVFAGVLGVTGAAVVSGVLNAFQALNPLLVTGAVYVERIGLGFQTWTQNGGVEKFGNYALNVLPQVASTLGSIAKLVLDVVTAAAPWGTLVLHALQGVAQALDTFPLPVLGTIAAGAAAGYGAFRLWNGVHGGIDAVRDAMSAVNAVIQQNIPMTQSALEKTAIYTAFLSQEAGVAEAVAIGEAEVEAATLGVGTAMDFAAGPIGVVLAIMGALAAVITVAAASTEKVTKATDDYTAAVQQDNGAIGENIRLQAAQNLAKSGAYDIGKKLGLSSKDVLTATLDEAMATKTATDALVNKINWAKYANGVADEAWSKTGKVNQADIEYANNVDKLTAKQKEQSSEIKKQIDLYNAAQEAIGGTTIKTGAAGVAQQKLADTYGMSVTQYIGASDAQKKAADQLDATTREMQFQNDAAGLLRNALDLLNGKTLDLAEAQTSIAAANNSTIDSLKQNKTVVDGNSKAAVANQQAIQGAVEAAQQYSEAVGKSTGSSEQARQALITSKQQMEDTLKSQGLLTGGVQAYIDKIFQIPTVVDTRIDIDTAVATLKVQALAKEIVDLSSAYNSVTARMPGSIAVTKNATGGTIGGYATGGTPGLAGGGPSGTVFGPGTSTSDSILTRLSVGEEVIKASSAQQIRPLLKAINRDPNAAVSGLVGQGVAIGAAAAVDKSRHLHIHETGWSPEAMFSEFTRRENLANQ